MKAAKVVISTLAEMGIPYLAGVIGSSIEDIVESAAGNATLRYISVRHEQVAASMCDGYAKVSGRPMACIAHAGPGACNLLVGVASAFRDSTPMLVITGNLGSSRLGRGAWHELDIEAIYRPVTKWTTRVRRPSETAEVIRRAFHTAIEGRPGPVHVDIPQDIAAAEVADSAQQTKTVGKSHVQAKPAADAEATGRILRMIQAAKRPLILAGGGVFWSRASELLLEAAERMAVPVVTTETSRGVLPEDNPLCLGTAGFSGNPGSNRAAREADLIVGIGCQFSEKVTLGWTLIQPATAIVQVDIDPKEIARQYPVEIGMVADARAFLQELLEQVKADRQANEQGRAERQSWVRELQALRLRDLAAFFEKAVDTVPIKPQAIIKDVIEAAGREAIVAVGQGNLTSFCTRVPVYGPGRALKSAGLGTMGFAFPAALGAKLASPERSVLCLVGDGDFGMVMQDLDTAVRESLGVVIVVFNNGGYGVNRLNQMSRSVEPFGVNFINPDFAALARMYGMSGSRIEKAQDFRPALQEALRNKGPALFDVFIDPNERVGANPKAVGLYT